MESMAALRKFNELPTEVFNDESIVTVTSEDQEEVEWSVGRLFGGFSIRLAVDENLPRLLRCEHTRFLKRNVAYLPSTYQCLDASRTWLCYWILHSLALLEVKLPETVYDSIVTFLAKCQHKDGGFGGGPGQFAHLAPTYAAVNALCIIGTKRAYNIINRKTLQTFLSTLRSPEGAFSMHKNGEVDIRGVYCALSVATLTNILTEELLDKTAEWVVGCQTYEGGFSGYPGMEAHGGYTFCGLASLIILRKGHLCDVQGLLRWVVNKQMRLEGGFQGRTNKLVDGCYSFWQGGALPLLHSLLIRDDYVPDSFLFDQGALQEYVLICCQQNDGGLVDKPGKPRDIYHTCYTLSGLSISQYSLNGSIYCIGPIENKLAPTHPIYNIGPDLMMRAMSYFSRLEVPSHYTLSS